MQLSKFKHPSIAYVTLPEYVLFQPKSVAYDNIR
jgi:hypothetical protein